MNEKSRRRLEIHPTGTNKDPVSEARLFDDDGAFVRVVPSHYSHGIPRFVTVDLTDDGTLFTDTPGWDHISETGAAVSALIDAARNGTVQQTDKGLELIRCHDEGRVQRVVAAVVHTCGELSAETRTALAGAVQKALDDWHPADEENCGEGIGLVRIVGHLTLDLEEAAT